MQTGFEPSLPPPKRRPARRMTAIVPMLGAVGVLLWPIHQDRQLTAAGGWGQRPVTELGAGQTQALSLDLSLATNVAVRGESIPCIFTLTNRGRSPLNLLDDSRENRAFSVRVTGTGGFQVTGDMASVRVREGEHIEAPRSPQRRVLAPAEELQVKGDITAWVGELPPGSYTVTGQYSGSPAMRASSKPSEFRVAEASIAFACLTGSLLTAAEPSETAWINRGQAGYDLFLLRSSPYAPAVAYSNRRIARLAEPSPVRVSAYNVSGRPTHHMVWVAPGSKLQVARLSGDAQPEPPRSISLPAEKMGLIDPPYTSEKGTLYVILVTSDGEASLLELTEGGKPVFRPLAILNPNTPRRALWDRQDGLVFAFAGKDRKSFSVVIRKAGAAADDSRRSYDTSYPILDISMGLRYRESDSGYDRVAVILCGDISKGEYLRRQVNLDSGKTEGELRFSSPIGPASTLLQAVLTRNFAARYLFSAPDGTVHFLNPDLSRNVALVARDGKMVRQAEFPTLMVASEFSRQPGIFVRYVEDGRRFSYIRVE